MILEFAAGALVIAAAVLFTRLWPRRGYPSLGIDAPTFLLMGRTIRENGFRIPRKMDSYLIKGDFDYPPLFAYIVALLPEKGAASRSRFINPSIDVVHAWLVAGAAFLLGGFWAGFAAGMLFAIAPISVYESFTLNSRPFSALLVSLLMLVSFKASAGGALELGLAALLFALVLLAHKMAAQFSAAALVALAVIFANPVFAAIAIAGLVLAVILSGGLYLKILRGHFAIISFWKKYTNRRRAFGSAQWLANSLSKAVTNPWAAFAIAYVVVAPLSPATQYLWVWLAVSLALFLLTSPKQLAFLGENHRYLEYSVLPAFTLAALFLTSNAASLPVLALSAVFVLGGALVLHGAWAKLAKSAGFFSDGRLDECARFVKKRKEDRLLIAFDATTFFAYATRKKILSACTPTVWEDLPFLVFTDEIWKQLPLLLKRFRIQLIVARSGDAARLKDTGRKIFDNGAYAVFVVK
ncbi:Uncharacterised protein [Candidatus Norongarragalina meridionalis]|nr:Uncharacterised protein [Candidatus Norongarragalina meridionalis]